MRELVNAARLVYEADPLDKSRELKNIWARMAVYSVMYDSGLTLERIGKKFGKGHATVIHALKRHRNLLEVDREYQQLYDRFIMLVRSNDHLKLDKICGKTYFLSDKKHTILKDLCELPDSELERIYQQLQTA